MKKLIFTAGSVLLVISALFMACVKSKNTTSTATAAATGTTTGSTTSTPSANTMVVDGSSHSVTTGTSVIGSTFAVISNTTLGGYPSISLYFAGTSAPAAATYTASANYPTSGNCGASATPSTSTTWTVVSCKPVVTSGSSRSVTFSNATFTDGANTHTISVNLPF
ncbi:MAG TPA: hypothetical protein VNY73_10430 [Bacteroidia bacterium]|jgi:hypothetical protein|nr:hypothetical protein [Bacteroidia bacterium]